jgi:hypothetical protein
MANDITQQFAGLPIEDLIVQPLVGMAKGQAQLNDVTWKYISQVAFEKDPNAKDDKAPLVAKSLNVTLNRFVTNPETGAQDIQYINSQVPLLPLVPLPALSITSADIEFSMEVKSTEMSKDSTDSSAEATASFEGGFWGMKYNVSMTGKIATHKENTRSTDNSAKYNVKVHAEQLPPTEGMLKLSDMLQMMMEPSIVQPGKNQNE